MADMQLIPAGGACTAHSSCGACAIPTRASGHPNNKPLHVLSPQQDVTCELGSTIDPSTNPTGYGQLNLNSNWEYTGPQWRCYVSVPAENDDLTALATFYGVSGGLSSAAPGAATLGYFPTNNADADAANLYLYTNGTAYPGATVNVCNNTLQSVGGNNASCNVGIQTPADQIESVYYYTWVAPPAAACAGMPGVAGLTGRLLTSA